MRYFPIFVDLKDRRVVVVGGGEEAVRKIRLLKKTPAEIHVVAEVLHEELQDNRVAWLGRTYAAAFLDGATLVYSADPALNALVSRDAQDRGIPVNAVDQADISTFLVPSIVDRDPVVIAIGTEGTAPVLSQGIRAKIDAMLPPKTGLLASAAANLRSKVAELVPHGNRRRAFWRTFFFGAPKDAFYSGDPVAFELAVGDAVFEEARPAIGKVSIVTVTGNDADDLTLRSHRLLQEADVLVVEGAVPAAVLEMARRDALRIVATSAVRTAETARAHATAGLHVVHVRMSVSQRVAAGVPFPTRDDIRDAILRVAS
jgi:uroporphyrin-III C-methyltransferase / precorrin-2 dehydrogenase / sirohydrochlorin ferrochelatase